MPPPAGVAQEPRSRSARRASGCTIRGPAATSTKGGRGGCSSSTSSRSRRFTTATCATAACTQRFDAIILPDQTPREHDRWLHRQHRPAGISRRHRRPGRRSSDAIRRRRRHAHHAWQRVGLRDRSLSDSDQRFETRPEARTALRAGHDPPDPGGHEQSGRLRDGAQHVRVLRQQPVLLRCSTGSTR